MKVNETFNGTPQIRIINKKLIKYGFNCGDSYKILYLQDKLVILKIEKDEKN